jgi:hypothetical protein
MDITPEMGLWRAVFDQALSDARIAPALDKIKAINWITQKSNDFVTVCDLAGVCPSGKYRELNAALLKTSFPHQRARRHKKS